MDKYRKRPVVIEAVQVRHDNLEEIKSLKDVRLGLDERLGLGGPICVYVETLEGTMRGDLGDWIIRGISGELYPCKDSIFRETYESATA